ncbi:MAG: hypothetical protein WCQ41_02885, partial [Bacillota bacterium]
HAYCVKPSLAYPDTRRSTCLVFRISKRTLGFRANFSIQFDKISVKGIILCYNLWEAKYQ